LSTPSFAGLTSIIPQRTARASTCRSAWVASNQYPGERAIRQAAISCERSSPTGRLPERGDGLPEAPAQLLDRHRLNLVLLGTPRPVLQASGTSRLAARAAAARAPAPRPLPRRARKQTRRAALASHLDRRLGIGTPRATLRPDLASSAGSTGHAATSRSPLSSGGTR
jgi:hypothetical protein